MPGQEAPFLTYGDTVTFQIASSDAIALLGPGECPFIQYFGLSGDPGKFRVIDWPSTKVQWFEDALPPLTCGLGAAVTSTTQTTVTLASGAGWAVLVGDVVQVDSEYMWVSGRSGDNLTVTRGFWGSTAATHASTATVTRVTNANLEGSVNLTTGASVPTQNYNYTQIFRDVISVSNTEALQSRYGIPDVLAYRTALKTKDLMRMIEIAAFTGVRNVGGANAPRTMGGLGTFITTNTVSMSNAYITEAAINKVFRMIYEACGEPPNLIVCAPLTGQTIDELWKSYLHVQPSQDTIGLTVRRITTRFGDAEVLVSPFCPADKAYILNSKEVGFLEFRPLKGTQLGARGDLTEWQLVGEYTLVVRNDQKHGVVTGIKTT